MEDRRVSASGKERAESIGGVIGKRISRRNMTLGFLGDSAHDLLIETGLTLQGTVKGL